MPPSRERLANLSWVLYRQLQHGDRGRALAAYLLFLALAAVKTRPTSGPAASCRRPHPPLARMPTGDPAATRALINPVFVGTLLAGPI